MCLQKNSDIATGTKTAMMYSGVASAKYQFCEKVAAYARYEMFNDKNGFMSGIIIDKNNMLTGLKEMGVTAGVEYKPTDASYVRLEARQIEMDKNQEIFHWKNDAEDSRLEILFNMGISF
ncbi:MAG TPA: outer membrane beta-barrel protein, partial [Bacteroidia bacterium]|nr:outer membrane beta-barrel protein [Bacteroidia bacterium]